MQTELSEGCTYPASWTLEYIQYNNARGFTLIELIVVLTLIGILGAYVSVTWKSQGTYTASQQADRLAAHIRHTQALATAWDLSLRLDITASGYQILCVGTRTNTPCINANDIVRDPATGKLLSVTMDAAVSISGIDTDFDSLGRPRAVAGALLSTARNFTVAFGTQSYAVALSPITGFVSVTP